jgi:cytochrome c-type biogenesis protein CcmH
LITFYLACAGLVLLSAVFYLFPRRRGAAADDDVARANVEWLKLREAELAGEDDALREEARLRLLEDGALEQPPQPQARARAERFPAWALLPVVALMSAALYAYLGAAPDVMISRQLDALGQSSTEQDMQRLADAMAQRAEQRPDNLQYHALLGRYYMGAQDYEAASASFNRLVAAAPEDAEALAYAAQAQYLAAGRVLDAQTRLRAEQALAANPHQRTALGLLGMASYEQGEYRAAINYWERLLAVETPGSQGAAMIADVIARARAQLGEPVDEVQQPGAAAAPVAAAGAGVEPGDAAGPGVTVTVQLPPQADAQPSDTVFILARNAAGGSRMPIAVQRLSVAQLPITVRLDDSNSMAGQTFSAEQPVIVAAQVSPEGRPGLAGATWAVEVGPISPSASGEAVTLALAPVER